MTFTATAAEILAIPLTAPERLFTGDLTLAKQEYRQLLLFWHPDRNHSPQAKAVSEHINVLYDKAKEMLEKGIWFGSRLFETLAGKTFRLHYRRRIDFELGECYISPTTVVFAVEKLHQTLFEAAVGRIDRFRFRNDEMRKDIERLLPQVGQLHETADRYLLILKHAGKIRVRDLHAYLGTAGIPLKHIAWIISRLYRIVAYHQWAGFAHNDISMDTVFVGPEDHSAVILGGWWYSTALDARMKVVPNRTFSVLSKQARTSQLADTKTDLELIRLLGRELLGDWVGVRLLANKAIPTPISRWFNLNTSGDAITDHDKWYETMKEAFGPRKFIELPVTFNNVYP